MGVRVQLGHAPGVKCSNPGDVVPKFTVLHTNGIHVVHVRFCRCEGAASRHVQLLRTRWWPATSQSTQTAATMELMRTFRVLNLQARANATDFYRSFVILTDDSRMLDLPVRTCWVSSIQTLTVFIPRIAWTSFDLWCTLGGWFSSSGRVGGLCWLVDERAHHRAASHSHVVHALILASIFR
jgi:hypothetical protein